MEEEYGKLLYEYSDAVSPLDMTKTQRKKHLKSFMAITNLICMLLLTVWCVCNFALDLKVNSFGYVIRQYIFIFFALTVVILITVLSVFGLWGKFLRSTKFYRPRRIEERERLDELRSDIKSYDDRKNSENSIKIYENAIVLYVNGVKKFIHRSTRYTVTMIKQSKANYLFFDAEYTGNIELKLALPLADGYLIKKYLADNLREIDLTKEKPVKQSKEKKEKKRVKTHSFATVEVPALVCGIATIIVGIILVVIGYYDLMNGMPMSAGGFVIMFGQLLVCIAFINFPIVNIFFLHVSVSATFAYMGICFLLIIEEAVTGAPVTFMSLLRHPTIYSVCCLFFVSFAISLIPNAIKSLIEYLKYK